MVLNPIIRKYKMADGDLLQIADHIKSCVARDISGFASRNGLRTRLGHLMAARTAFADFPTHAELEKALTTAIENRNSLRDLLEMLLDVIRVMVETEFGGVGVYRTFWFGTVPGETDNSLARRANRIYLVALSLQSALEPKGLTDMMLSTLCRLMENFDHALDAVEAATASRDLHTQQRVAYGNTLFDIVTELTNTGKSLWEDMDEAKYNDYVIYDVPAEPARTAA